MSRNNFLEFDSGFPDAVISSLAVIAGVSLLFFFLLLSFQWNFWVRGIVFILIFSFGFYFVTLYVALISWVVDKAVSFKEWVAWLTFIPMSFFVASLISIPVGSAWGKYDIGAYFFAAVSAVATGTILYSFAPRWKRVVLAFYFALLVLSFYLNYVNPHHSINYPLDGMRPSHLLIQVLCVLGLLVYVLKKKEVLAEPEISIAQREKSVGTPDILEFLEDYFSKYGGLSPKEILDKVKKLISDNPERVIQRIDENSLTPDQFVWILLNKAIENELVYGRYHVYRGTLGEEGNDLYALWKKCMSDLYGSGFLTDKDYQENLDWMASAIRDVG